MCFLFRQVSNDLKIFGCPAEKLCWESKATHMGCNSKWEHHPDAS